MNNSKIKTIVSTLVITLVVVAAAGGAVYEYHLHKPKPTISTAQALKQRDEAVRVMNLHDSVNQTTEAKLTEQNADKQNRLATVCAALKTTKVTSPACN